MKIKFFGIIILTLAMTGCVVTVDSDHESSSRWDEADVDQIRVGETSKDWVLDALGTPNRKRIGSDGTEVWRYKNISERDTKIRLLFLLRFDLERERHNNLRIEIKDDIVVDYWLESDWVE